MKVHFVRHTAVALEPGICYGQSDVLLSKDYARDLRQVKNVLQSIDFKEIYTSPLSRCVQLATDLAAANNCTVRSDERLMELNFGDWELTAWDEIDQSALENWADDIASFRCPNGESYEDLRIRVTSFWEDVIDRSEEDVLVITHGGVVRTLLGHILGAQTEKLFNIVIDYGSLTSISVSDNQSKILYINR